VSFTRARGVRRRGARDDDHDHHHDCDHDAHCTDDDRGGDSRGSAHDGADHDRCSATPTDDDRAACDHCPAASADAPAADDDRSDDDDRRPGNSLVEH